MGNFSRYELSNAKTSTILAGAMRLPGKNDNPNDRMHYLTDGYIKDFNLQTQPFPNYDENGISKIYEFRAKTNGLCLLNSIQLQNVCPASPAGF